MHAAEGGREGQDMKFMRSEWIEGKVEEEMVVVLREDDSLTFLAI